MADHEVGEGDAEMSGYLKKMLAGTESPEYAERLRKAAANQEPWIVSAEPPVE